MAVGFVLLAISGIFAIGYAITHYKTKQPVPYFDIFEHLRKTNITTTPRIPGLGPGPGGSWEPKDKTSDKKPGDRPPGSKDRRPGPGYGPKYNRDKRPPKVQGYGQGRREGDELEVLSVTKPELHWGREIVPNELEAEKNRKSPWRNHRKWKHHLDNEAIEPYEM